MGKDKSGKFHPGKGKPSGANKEEGLGLQPVFDPERLENDDQLTEKYTESEDRLSPNVHIMHPNRNTSKGENHNTQEDQGNKSRYDKFSEETGSRTITELPSIITKDVYLELSSVKTTNAVSIFLPTHRAGVEVNEQVDVILI